MIRLFYNYVYAFRKINSTIYFLNFKQLDLRLNIYNTRIQNTSVCVKFVIDS